MRVTAARIDWISHAFITIVVSGIPLCSSKWWNGETANTFFLKYFLLIIWIKLDAVSKIKSEKIAKNGINIQVLIFNVYKSAANNHHIANAQLSPINILAGFILKNRNAINIAIIIAITAVAMYVQLKNVTTPRTKNITAINPHANQSNQSTILIAFTILIVIKKVSIGKNIHISILPAIGQRLT